MTLPPKATREELLQRIREIEDEKNAKEAARLASGTCRVCGGEARPVQKQLGGGLGPVFGRPPSRPYIDHYCCQDCGLMYGKRPTGPA